MIRRLIAAALAMMLVLAGISAVAEAIDLSAYDDAALIALLDQVQQEIVDRKIERTASLEKGRYTAGKDFPAGRYTIYMKYESDYMWGTVSVYPNGDMDADPKFYEMVFAESNPVASSKSEDTWSVVLDEGDLLVCSDPITLTISAGVQFK